MKKFFKRSASILITALLIVPFLFGNVSAQTPQETYLSKLGITSNTRFTFSEGYQIDEEVTKEGTNTIIIRTFVKPITTLASVCATFTKTYEEISESGVALRARVYGNFCWDEAANTISVSNGVGRILYLSSNWSVVDEDVNYDNGGSSLTKRWASVIYTFKRYNTVGLSSNKTVTVKINSAGQKVNAD